MKRWLKWLMSILMEDDVLIRLVLTFAISMFMVVMTEVLVRGETNIEVLNDSGENIECSTDYYVTLTPVEFVYTKSIDEGKCLCVSCSFDGGRSFEESIKLPGNSYIFYPREMNKKVVIAIYEMDTITSEKLLLGKYYIFTGLNDEAALSEFNYELFRETKDTMYLKGNAPRLRVNAAKGVRTFLSVVQNDEESIYEIESSMTVDFAQGEYVVKLYTEDFSGRINICKKFPLHFIYDATPPQNLDFCIYGDYRRFDNGKETIILSDKNLKISCDVQDVLSGVGHILFYKNGKEIEASMIELDDGYRGRISAKAIDECGNESMMYECNESFIIESTAPVVTFSEQKVDNKILVEANIRDQDSGIFKIAAYVDGRLYDEIKYDKRVEQEKMTLEFPDWDDASNNHGIEVVATDLAGNRADVLYDLEYIDTTAPYVKIRGVLNAKSYASDVNINVIIDDKSISYDGIEIISTHKKSDGSVSTRKHYYGEYLNFSEEGQYELEVRAIDKRGNLAEDKKHFNIDKSAPIINGVKEFDGKYLPSFSLKNLINDMFEDESLVEYKLYLNGENYAAENEINKEGHYYLKVIATDVAGNTSIDDAEFVIYNLADGKAVVSADNVGERKNKSNIIINPSKGLESVSLNTISGNLDNTGPNSDGIHEDLILLYLTIFSFAIATLIVFITIFRKKAGKDNGEKSQQRNKDWR